MRAKSVSERVLEKRRRILDAARQVMLRDGLRGTTMEAVARAAGIAKPTLYAHFADKEAVFAALVESLLDALLAAFSRGLESPGDAAGRIGEGLAQQYLLLAQLLEGSPHAAELMSEPKRLGLSLQDKDAAMLHRIEAILGAAGAADPQALARIVVAATYGIALKVRDEKTMAAGIRMACRRLIGPELTQKSSGGD